MSVYLSVFRLRLRMETQYRAAAVGGLLCQCFFALVLIALYRTLYAGSPQSLPLASVVTYVWLQQGFFRLLLSTDGELLDKVRTGAIAYDLCRPVSPYPMYFSRMAAQKLVGSLLRGAPMFVIAFLLPEGWGMTPPASPEALALALGALALGLLCVCALDCITMGITMRTIDHRGAMAMLNLLMVTFSGNLLPLTLFPDSWQRFVRLLPYAQILDAPCRLYTGTCLPGEVAEVFLCQTVWIALLICLGLWIWRRNLSRMALQGG